MVKLHIGRQEFENAMELMTSELIKICKIPSMKKYQSHVFELTSIIIHNITLNKKTLPIIDEAFHRNFQTMPPFHPIYYQAARTVYKAAMEHKGHDILQTFRIILPDSGNELELWHNGQQLEESKPKVTITMTVVMQC